MRLAMRALVAYAWPVIIEVSAPAHARPPVGVVWHTKCHEQRTDVCVTKTKLTEQAAVFANLFCWVVGVTNKNFLCGEHDFDGVTVCVYVEDVVVAQGTSAS